MYENVRKIYLKWIIRGLLADETGTSNGGGQKYLLMASIH